MLALVIEVVDRVAVSEDDSVVVPLAAEDIYQKTVAGTARFAFIAVVCTHHLTYVAFLYEGLESRKICLPEVTHRDGSVI